MNERTKTGLEILQASLLVGVLGNILLRQTPWGLNAFLFVAAFVAALVMVARRRRPEFLTLNNLALMSAMVFFASMFLIRDSIELRVYDTLAIIVIMGVMMLSSFNIQTHVAGAFHYVAGVIWSGITSVFGIIALVAVDIEWSAMPGNKISRNLFSVLRGLAIALPLVLIFGGLFMAADAVFEGLVNRAINFDLGIVVGHVVLTSFLAWLTAGYLRGAMLNTFASAAAAAPPEETVDDKASDASFVARVAEEPGENPSTLPDNATILDYINRSEAPDKAEPAAKPRDWQNIDNSVLPPVFTLGTVETVIILGLVDLLFLSFVIVQVPYLFGGMELVQTTPDFKLADYARRGFGELVAVAALVLPMLLVSHWLLRRETGRSEKIFRVLAGVQIALLFVIMTSAVQRLVLLTGEVGYGMTTVRFYPMVFMLWLAVVFAWFAITVFRGARQHFAWGALWSAIVILGATNLMNPDAFIARTNIQLMQQGREFDAYYNSQQLSADAVPTLLSGLSSMPFEDQCGTKAALHHRYRELGQQNDLRSLNLARRTAFGELRANDATLHQTEGCPLYDQVPYISDAGE